MSTIELQTRRTGWDVVFGILLLTGRLSILGDAALATKVSIVFIGWIAVIVGLVALVASLFRIGKGGFWSGALSGGLLFVLGMFFLRNTAAAALTLTLIAGVIFLTSGIVRLMAAGHDPEIRAPPNPSGARPPPPRL